MNIVFWLLIIALLAVAWTLIFPFATIVIKMLFKIEDKWEEVIDKEEDMLL